MVQTFKLLDAILNEKTEIDTTRHNVELYFLYPYWTHRKCVGLAFRWSRVRASLAAVRLVICSPHMDLWFVARNTWSSGGTAMWWVVSNGQSTVYRLPVHRNWIYRLWRHCPYLVVVNWNWELPIWVLQ